MNIYDGFGYTGGEFKLIYQDIIGYLQGNSLCLWNLESNKKEYIQSNRNGYQTFCANKRKKLIAVAEYGLNPSVYIYSYPSREQVQILSDVSGLEIIMMDFSYDCRYLLVVTGVPAYQICIWDLQLGQRIRGANSILAQKFNFQKASFSCTNDNRFMIIYQTVLLSYEIIASYELEGGQLVKNLKLEQKAQINLKGQNQFIVWDYLSELDTGDIEQTNIYLVQDNMIFYHSGLDLHEIANFQCKHLIKHLVVTQRHIIVVYDTGLIEWYFKYVNVNLNDQAFLPFKLDKQYKAIQQSHGEHLTSQVLYNQRYNKLIIGLVNASLIILNVNAEAQMEEEDEGDQGKEQNDEDVREGQIKQVDVDAIKLGPYQTGSVMFIKEFHTVNVLVSGSSTGKIVFWDIIKRDSLSSIGSMGQIVSGDLSLNDQLLILGSSQGVIRVLNVANIRKPVLIKMIKIFKGKPVSQVTINPTQDTIALSSIRSKKIYFLSLKFQNIIGYVVLPVTCNNIKWNSSAKAIQNYTGPQQLFAVTSFLLITITPPDPNQAYDSLRLDKGQCQIHARKIDPDQHLISIHHQTGEIFTAGKDKVFKRYKQPEEQLQKLDLKIRIANSGPIDEQDGHALAPTCLTISNKLGSLCSGAEDGTLMIRSYDRLSQDVKIFKAHALLSGGVSALEPSAKYKMLYSGGFDGSIFWWSNEKQPKSDSDAEKVMRNLFDIPLAVQDLVDEEVMHYQLVLEQEYIESQAPIREQQKKEKKDLIQKIKDKLYNLIDRNTKADTLEQLSRHDFVIDVANRDQIETDGQKQCQDLREQVKRENYRQEILYKLIKERTWDQMEVNLKGINGLKSNILVTNFHIRIRGPEELRRLQLVKELRRQELKEKNLRKITKVNEIWSIEEMLQDPRSYIVNAVPGQPQMVLTDYEKKEEQQQGVVAKGIQGGPTKAQVGQKAAPARGLPGAKAATKTVDAKKQEEEREKEEKEKEEKEKERAAQKLEEKREAGEEFDEWDYIYGGFELFTNNRKRNQMILLNNIIFSIKKQFNLEFEKMMQQRQTEVENINERNKRITEILNELKKPLALFKSQKNLLENPEIILTVNNDEIKQERYLSKEEREKREAERKKEEERLAALMKDDSGIRAVKDMMSGTLEEKKETPLDEKLEVEEWMKKPQDDMTEDERIKLKEFEVKKQRLEEEKEKIKKNLESDLRKLRQDILDICNRYDDSLLILFRRKLEYDYRIYEQELYIIRLALSIIMQDQGNAKIKELKQMISQLEIKDQQAKEMQENLEMLRKETELQKQRQLEQMNAAYNVKQMHGFDVGKIKNLWLYAFEEIKRDDKKQKELDKKLIEDPQYKDVLVVVDTLFEFEKKQVKKQRDDVFDNFIKDIQEKVQNLQLFDWGDLQARELALSTLQNRFNIKKEYEKLDTELNELKLFSAFNAEQVQEIQSLLETSHNDNQDISTMMEKSKSNVEILIRFKQGFVEITSDKPVPNLTEAILIARKHIDEKNKEIQGQGDHKIKLMEDIKKIKFDVAQSEYQLKKRELIIKDLECKTREVQLLKVKKEMQVALTKKDTRLNDQELKNLQDQIDMLKQATEKRILIYIKKEEKIKKDIEFIQKENEQLLSQGANLNVSVKQLQEISDMTFKKNQKQNKEGEEVSDNQAFDKFKQISSNRKYFDLAKKQTEEIELLREELNKLKARTFANFANVSR